MKSNMIWDKVAGFMQQLRCENLSQKTMVQMPELLLCQDLVQTKMRYSIS